MQTKKSKRRKKIKAKNVCSDDEEDGFAVTPSSPVPASPSKMMPLKRDNKLAKRTN